MTTTDRVIQLHPDDNVVICIRTLQQHEEIMVDGLPIRLEATIDAGHKLARTAIPAAAAIIKYGVIIGTSTCAIPAGTQVHIHNMKSNYIPTYLFSQEQASSENINNHG